MGEVIDRRQWRIKGECLASKTLRSKEVINFASLFLCYAKINYLLSGYKSSVKVVVILNEKIKLNTLKLLIKTVILLI